VTLKNRFTQKLILPLFIPLKTPQLLHSTFLRTTHTLEDIEVKTFQMNTLYIKSATSSITIVLKYLYSISFETHRIEISHDHVSNEVLVCPLFENLHIRFKAPGYLFLKSFIIKQIRFWTKRWLLLVTYACVLKLNPLDKSKNILQWMTEITVY